MTLAGHTLIAKVIAVSHLRFPLPPFWADEPQNPMLLQFFSSFHHICFHLTMHPIPLLRVLERSLNPAVGINIRKTWSLGWVQVGEAAGWGGGARTGPRFRMRHTGKSHWMGLHASPTEVQIDSSFSSDLFLDPLSRD